jgi:predicted aldo/keto reductase-like oxidoreductase
MKYRPFGKLDWQGSALGFGCMRLPVIDGKAGQIDEERAIAMIRYGIDHGVNYIDTAYPYHEGMSEPLVGKALLNGYRQKVKLATKMPVWLLQTKTDLDKYLNEQLTRLQTDTIDFYLLHALNKVRWPLLLSLDIQEWIQKAKGDGRIQHIGFSFHDEYPVFEEIINGYDGWDFCQIQYNYMDIEEQAGEKGLKLAAAKGLAVVVMEPMMGGRLSSPPPSVSSILDQSENKRTPTDWALQWLWNQPEVSLVLSGMSDETQVKENLESADRAKIGSLSKKDFEIIEQARLQYRSVLPVPCTKCRYCMPCPNGVNIPVIFEVFNKGVMMKDWWTARFRYGQLPADEKGDQCVECGACEGACPQQIQIIEWLKIIDDVLGKNHEWEGRRP